MGFDPQAEPCYLCGREPDECICDPTHNILDTEDVWDEFTPEEEDV